MTDSTHTSSAIVITPDQFLEHWQGHRRLTRRTIDAFPDDKLDSFSVGGMRPFSKLALEMVGMAVPSLEGLRTGTWAFSETPALTTKADIMMLWDLTTAEIKRLWPMIPPHRFQETDKAFGQWDMQGYALLLYIVDNEIHHRAQGTVYLRALGIEPPAFPDRS
jgi:uncharacterized damage-inducible protein DinB